MSGVAPGAEPASSSGPAFVFLTEGRSQAAAASPCIAGVAERCAPVLGFEPRVEIVAMSGDGAPPAFAESLPEVDAMLGTLAEAGHAPVFLLPLVLDLSLGFKQLLGASLREAQRLHPGMPCFVDDVDSCHPLLLQAFVDAALRAASFLEPPPDPRRLGLLLVADGEGDATLRAKSYQLMRLVWEQVGCATGDVAFLRHDRTPLPEKLEEGSRSGCAWVLVPQVLFAGERLQYAKTIADDFAKRQGLPAPWPMAPPIGDHPNVGGWLDQRLQTAWKSHRDARARRSPSIRARPLRPTRICGPEGAAPLDGLPLQIPEPLLYGDGLVADVSDPMDLRALLRRVEITGDVCFVKVTWHGYAPGTYTDPVALDALLDALPCRAVVVEGHTSSRNTGGADFDWETDALANRAWIRAEEQRYLERTGLREVLARHGAQYLNVTEAFWDGALAPPEQVLGCLEEAGVHLHHEELLGYVPEALFARRGAPFLSFARFKGPTRLSISNLFGLLPEPLRTAWHGPNLTYMARVCCDLAKLYGTLFDAFGVVEGLNVAVRFDRKGLHRSRWGHYDLVDQPGLLTLSRGFATADVLASRLQGQDVARSAFFDVVRHELGVTPRAQEAPIDPALVRRLV